MRFNACLAFITLAAAAGSAVGQTVQFRVIERNSQVVLQCPPGTTPATDGVLNYAVQARVVGGTATQGIGDFRFDIVATGEQDVFGVLHRLVTSNADGTFAVNMNNTESDIIGRGGLAAQYSYPATINPDFNGLINTSGGTFTNNPGSQEIGMIAGSPAGPGLLLRSDLNLDGNPDTYPGSGVLAPLDPTYAALYLGAGGNFTDVYRFKYTARYYPAIRSITFELTSISAQITTGLERVNGTWGPVQSPAPTTTLFTNPVSFSFGCLNCRPDYNHLGGITVQDIFDFINDWLAGLPWADFNSSGTLSPQDIFDFMNAWFARC